MMQSEDRYAFDFGTGEPALDYVKIMSDTLYEPERGTVSYPLLALREYEGRGDGTGR